MSDTAERSNVSDLERRTPRVRWTMRILTAALLVFLAIACAGPLLVLAKWSITTTRDIVTDPLGWWPSGVEWTNLSRAFTEVGIGRYFLNTIVMVLGVWGFGLLVALTGGYVIAILRPRWAKVLNAAVLATLFIPGVISLIPLYVTVLDLPLIGVNLVNTFWAVWLPSAASAFHVLLVTRFFENLPRDVFEAARVDGAGPLRIFVSLVLPMSRPIIGVVSLLTIVAAWKDFLWPLLVLPSTELQPLSVALPRLQTTVEEGLQMASLFIAVIIPVALFLVFQRQFLRNAGSAGAIKE